MVSLQRLVVFDRFEELSAKIDTRLKFSRISASFDWKTKFPIDRAEFTKLSLQIGVPQSKPQLDIPSIGATKVPLC